mgnify:CR=1 FL=1
MAVKYVQEKSGLGSLLGTIATIAGGFSGAPSWLSTLGTGLTTLSNVMNGGGSGLDGLLGNNAMSNILNGIVCGGWANPASGSIMDYGNMGLPNSLNKAKVNDVLKYVRGL